jgi:phosphate transport system substrate-binding protein
MNRRDLFAVFFALVAGCKGGDSPEAGGALPGSKKEAPAEKQESGDVHLTGAGATFPYPLYTKWIAAYGELHKDAKINYQSIGSGGGIRQITERTVDFGASDAPMSDEQIGKAPGILHIPTCLGAVAITYNLEGVVGLKLSPATLAGIFLGDVKKWSDPAVKADNPDLKLPDKDIASIHRSDGSGTTKIFVDYLTAVSPKWASGPGTGTSVNWPGGLGAKGNEGVAGQVKSTPGSIGYVELAYVIQNGMASAAIGNKAGKFVAPSLESTTAAGAGAAARIPDDLRVSIVNADGEGAYPIAGFTYVLVYGEQADARKGRVVADFLRWALTDGQRFAPELHYAKLPTDIAEKALVKVKALAGPDKKPLLGAN